VLLSAFGVKRTLALVLGMSVPDPKGKLSDADLPFLDISAQPIAALKHTTRK
jgi:hypothetical protein